MKDTKVTSRTWRMWRESVKIQGILCIPKMDQIGSLHVFCFFHCVELLIAETVFSKEFEDGRTAFFFIRGGHLLSVIETDVVW